MTALRLLGRNAARRPVSGLASDPHLLSSMAALSEFPLYRNNRAELLIDGPATYQKMLDSIRGARRQVLLETYIFADDEVGRRFAELLKAKSREGLLVAIVYDSIGSIRSDGSFFDDMKAAGVRVLEFNDVHPVKGNLLKVNNRSHRKVLIVDGRIAFTGGINLSRTYLSSSAPVTGNRDPLLEGWRDTQIAITGPAVEGFSLDFGNHWHRISGERLPETAGEANRAEQPGQDDVLILTATGGDNRASAIIKAYKAAIRGASDRIWITQAYFAPARGLISNLRKAAKRGVDVRIIVPGITDSPIVRHASRSWYGTLLRKGIRIYESTHALLHAKTAVIDGVWSTVGTSNLDYRSFLHNDEINAVVFGTAFGRQMERQFRRDVANCRSINLDDWKRRPVLDRLIERLSRTVEYWL